MMRNTARTVLVAACALGIGACEGPNLFTGPATTVAEGPVVLALIVPESVRPNEVLEVEIQAAGPRGIRAVDVTLIEDAVRERTLTIDPPELDVSRIAEFQLPATITRSVVVVRVEVEDERGFRSDPREVEIPVIQDDGAF